MSNRPKLSPKTAKVVLEKSGRRCAICFGLHGDLTVKKGQIAHLDHNASNNKVENLCFLCFQHHDEYDSRTSQSKGLMRDEVLGYRATLHSAVARVRRGNRDLRPVKGDLLSPDTLALIAEENGAALSTRHRKVKLALANNNLQHALASSLGILRDHPWTPRGNYNLACVYSRLAEHCGELEKKEEHIDSAVTAFQDALEFGVTSLLKLSFHDPNPVKTIQDDPDLLLVLQRPGVKALLKEFEDQPKVSAGNKCVSAEMLIHTDDTTVPLKSRTTGDTVSAFDVDSNTLVRARIAALRFFETNQLIRFNDCILVTPCHPVLTNHGWLPAGEIDHQSKLARADGSFQSVKSIELVEKSHRVVDLEIKPVPTFVVNGVIVHNKI